jgi:para-nitrobenzyl esterase
MLGTNRHENRLFNAFVSRHVAHVFGVPWRIRDLRAYMLESDLPSLMWKARGVDEPAMVMAGHDDDGVFAYRFDWDEEGSFLWLDLHELLGAAHGMEVPFVFGRLSFFGFDGPFFRDDRSEIDLALSRAMVSYWTQFAATGDPGRGRDGTLPEWKPWGRDGQTFVVLDDAEDEGIRMSEERWTREAVLARIHAETGFRTMEARCRVYGGLLRWSDVLTPAEYAQLEGGACRDVPIPERR